MAFPHLSTARPSSPLVAGRFAAPGRSRRYVMTKPAILMGFCCVESDARDLVLCAGDWSTSS